MRDKLAIGFRDLVIEASLMLGIAIVVAFMGPFGSYAIGDLSDRFAYWGVVLFGGYAVIRPVLLGAPWLARWLRFPELAVWIGLTVLASAPLTLLVFAAGGATRRPNFAAFAALYPNVLLLATLITLLYWTLRRRPQLAAERAVAGDASAPSAGAPIVSPPAPLPPTASTPPDPISALGPRLIERLPPHLGRDIVALEMEDHYVRVHTPAGSALLLMRMRDAVAEMAGVEGMQVHRSWWVARAAVRGSTSDGRNLRLRLDGLTAPVARGAVATLRDSGWIARE